MNLSILLPALQPLVPVLLSVLLPMLVEAIKKTPAFPLQPEQTGAIRAVVVAFAALLTMVAAYLSGNLAAFDVAGALGLVGQAITAVLGATGVYHLAKAKT